MTGILVPSPKSPISLTCRNGTQASAESNVSGRVNNDLDAISNHSHSTLTSQRVTKDAAAKRKIAEFISSLRLYKEAKKLIENRKIRTRIANTFALVFALLFFFWPPNSNFSSWA